MDRSPLADRAMALSHLTTTLLASSHGRRRIELRLLRDISHAATGLRHSREGDRASADTSTVLFPVASFYLLFSLPRTVPLRPRNQSDRPSAAATITTPRTSSG